ncbi:hypothetical protein [Segniliparus rugosus]|uniref:Uncharacterized protein n=1 Tax=Segniliparus rugosus (strain ATCC BAA-974 / DSM 45345 / CCUG 50838 / CIP 108380 / JCM 13579 / CDC 945) TaxID=679197 RepID=E5XQT3_SEGRC|nr:hypothetical protein [Segniliparus rugosus]EFV13268.1 hypothetical protein HMPREF9336_01855 [Segniliparus rugosus ATCC BAA-974]
MDSSPKKSPVALWVSLSFLALCALLCGPWSVVTYWTNFRRVDVAYEVTDGHGPVAVDILYPDAYHGVVATPFRLALSGPVSDSTVLYGITATAQNPEPNGSAPDIVIKVVADGREVCSAKGRTKVMCPAAGGAGGARV